MWQTDLQDATLKHNRQALRRGTREKVATLHAQQEEEEEFLDPYKPTTDLPRKKGVYFNRFFNLRCYY